MGDVIDAVLVRQEFHDLRHVENNNARPVGIHNRRTMYCKDKHPSNFCKTRQIQKKDQLVIEFDVTDIFS